LLAEKLKSELLKNNSLSNLTSAKITTWFDYSQSLFQAIKLERTSIVLLLLIIITVACFNLISGLYIQVSEKQKGMAILRTYGLDKSKISTIFIIQGVIIGLIGAAAGVLLGVFVSYNMGALFYWLQSANLLNSNNVFFNAIINHSITIAPDYNDIAIITTMALLICILATLIPAMRASKILPVEALRNE